MVNEDIIRHGSEMHSTRMPLGICGACGCRILASRTVRSGHHHVPASHAALAEADDCHRALARKGFPVLKDSHRRSEAFDSIIAAGGNSPPAWRGAGCEHLWFSKDKRIRRGLGGVRLRRCGAAFKTPQRTC